METKTASGAETGVNPYAESVSEEEWQKLRPLILRLFLALHESGLN